MTTSGGTPDSSPAAAAPAVAVETNLPWLIAAKAVRSFSQAILVIGLPLYFAAAGFSAVQVGYLLSLRMAGSIGVQTAVGVFGDRYGRRRVLLVLAVLGAAGAVAYLISQNFWVLAAVGGATAFGSGSGAGTGGNFGPFSPAEQALVSGSVGPRSRDGAFGRVGFAGGVASAAGSIVAGLPTLLHTAWHLPQLAALQSLLWIALGANLALAAVLLPVREPARAEPKPLVRGTAAAGVIVRLWVANGTNGFYRGVLGQFLTYWFFLRYGATAAEIGALYTIVNLAVAAPSLLGAPLARRLGAVRTVVLTRYGALVLLSAMALAPTFLLAAAALVARVVVNAAGMPVQQSFIMGMSEEEHRGRVQALGGLPAQITGAVSPALAVYLLETVSIEAPIWFAAGVMAVSTTLYGLLFRSLEARGTVS